MRDLTDMILALDIDGVGFYSCAVAFDNSPRARPSRGSLQKCVGVSK